jgi:hypothetical protein
MPTYNFKSIQVVPASKDFIDIVLSKTQRQTPTVVHNGWQITRIRSFYMRKVRCLLLGTRLRRRRPAQRGGAPGQPSRRRRRPLSTPSVVPCAGGGTPTLLVNVRACPDARRVPQQGAAGRLRAGAHPPRRPAPPRAAPSSPPGQARADDVARQADADPGRLPKGRGHPPLLLRPPQRAVRQGPLQAGAGAAQHRAQPHRQALAGCARARAGHRGPAAPEPAPRQRSARRRPGDKRRAALARAPRCTFDAPGPPAPATLNRPRPTCRPPSPLQTTSA